MGIFNLKMVPIYSNHPFKVATPCFPPGPVHPRHRGLKHVKALGLNPRRMVVPAITDLDMDTFDEKKDSQAPRGLGFTFFLTLRDLRVVFLKPRGFGFCCGEIRDQTENVRMFKNLFGSFKALVGGVKMVKMKLMCLM